MNKTIIEYEVRLMDETGKVVNVATYLNHLIIHRQLMEVLVMNCLQSGERFEVVPIY